MNSSQEMLCVSKSLELARQCAVSRNVLWDVSEMSLLTMSTSLYLK